MYFFLVKKHEETKKKEYSGNPLKKLYTGTLVNS